MSVFKPAPKGRNGLGSALLARFGIQRDRYIDILGVNNFVDNSIATTKYSVWSFLPKFLLGQFQKYNNVFFLFITLIQQIPGVSPTGRFTTLFPLAVILTLSGLKELFEDVKRSRSDRSVNNDTAEVLDPMTMQWTKTKWSMVQVGGIVKVKNNQFFPADLLLISSSEPNGVCYIETANLDGETNLKIRQSVHATYTYLTPKDLTEKLISSRILCDLPNKLLYEFSGSLTHADNTVPLRINQLLLRGAKLKNSSWIHGIVIYTGHEAKLMMNSTVFAPMKSSRVDQMTNTHIVALFIILLAVSIVSTIASILWNQNQDHWYMEKILTVHSHNYIFSLLTFIVLYNNLIPISLQIALEVVRFVQASFINADLEMYHAPSDTPAVARTSNLNEELGLVRYILSDKTGTLTRNVMLFKACSIAGRMFQEVDRSSLKNEAMSDANIREWCTLLAVCHTVVPELTPDSKGNIRYQASSPDEEALVKGVSNLGFKFMSRTPSSLIIKLANSSQESYELLNVLEFNSTRKRMSVIVRCPDKQIRLMMKGADFVITDRLSESGKRNLAVTMDHLEQFARIGLRTLCCASAILPEKDYIQWNKMYQDTLMAGGDNKEEKMDKLMDQIERGLTLLGATAVEDKLQDGVPETIKTLLSAKIKIWILTGDKRETAINIGHSCKLLGPDDPIILLNQKNESSLRQAMNNARPRAMSNLVVDGTSLLFLLEKKMKKDFFAIAMNCKSVICCRVSPSQKGDIVKLVKSRSKQITLAIGDGANDVAMIRAANVGVGISGNEGLQASHSADYSIAQFRYLTRLLLVHGNWSYGRTCKMILYSFYKNIALFLINMWFATVDGWSGATVFEKWSLSCYNMIFTVFPPLVIGIFDQNTTMSNVFTYPLLYLGHLNTFSPQVFWAWIWTGIFHSFFLFWFTCLICNHDNLWENGYSGGYLVFGNFLYTYVMITVCMKAGLESSSWNIFTFLSIVVSIGSWFTFMFLYSMTWPTVSVGSDFAGMNDLVFASPTFWLGVSIVPFTALLPDIAIKAYNRTFHKTMAEILDDMKEKIIDSALEKQGQADQHYRGYAFSQEENGAISQALLVKYYGMRTDQTLTKSE